MVRETLIIGKLVEWGKYNPAYRLLEKNLMKRVNGCTLDCQVDRND